jgi:hypothetical protein
VCPWARQATWLSSRELAIGWAVCGMNKGLLDKRCAVHGMATNCAGLAMIYTSHTLGWPGALLPWQVLITGWAIEWSAAPCAGLAHGLGRAGHVLGSASHE